MVYRSLLAFSLLVAAAAPVLAVTPVGPAFSSRTCDVWVGAGEPFCTIEPFSPGSTSPWNGMAMYTPVPVETPGGFTDSSASEKNLFSVAMTGWFAPSTSFTGETFPVSWDFVASSIYNKNTYGWNLEIYAMRDNESTFDLLSASGSGVLFGNHVTGSGITVPIEGEFALIFMDLTVTSEAPFSLNVPQGSTIDFNPVLAETPEPGTIFLGGSALLALAGLKARKRRN